MSESWQIDLRSALVEEPPDDGFFDVAVDYAVTSDPAEADAGLLPADDDAIFVDDGGDALDDVWVGDADLDAGHDQPGHTGHGEPAEEIHQDDSEDLFAGPDDDPLTGPHHSDGDALGHDAIFDAPDDAFGAQDGFDWHDAGDGDLDFDI